MNTRSIRSINKKRCIFVLALVFGLLFCSGAIFALVTGAEPTEKDTSAYIGTIFYEGVPVMTAGGGYRFYKDPACTEYAVGGSHEIHTDSAAYALYLKAEDGYTITNAKLTYADGTASPVSVSKSEGHFEISIPQGTSLTQNLKLHVDVQLDAKNEPIQANFALLEWKSKGESGSLSFELDGNSYNVHDPASYDEAYSAVFSKLWAQGTDYVSITNQTKLENKETKIWKVSGAENKLHNNLIIYEGATVIFLCEDDATIKANKTGKITVGGGTLLVQGKSDDAKLTFDGEQKTRTDVKTNMMGSGTDFAVDHPSRENLIQIRNGHAYFEYVQVCGVYSENTAGTGTQGGALQILPPQNSSRPAFLYVSDMLFTDCKAVSGAAFGSSTATQGSEIYFYNTAFDNCKTVKGINNVGGTAVRAGSGSGLYTFYKCSFTNNKLNHKFDSNNGRGYNAGGAVRWNIGENDLYTGIFNGCTFTNNYSIDRAGALYATGGLQLNACTLAYNTAENSGGAVAVASHSQNTYTKAVDMDGTVVFGLGTKIFENTVNNVGNGKVDGGGLGGAIHFIIGAAKAGTKNVVDENGATVKDENGETVKEDNIRENYRLVAEIKGAEIYDNTAARGGGIAVSIKWNYECGVNVYEGSSIHDNTATQDGGAIYIESDATYEKNGGVNILGGDIFLNTATRNGGSVYLQEGPVTISGGFLTKNQATQNGGAIYMGGGELTMSDGELSENNAENGAAAYLTAGTMTVSGGSITKNTAVISGGGAYLGGGELTMSGGELSENNAENGAAAYLNAGTMTVSGGSITKNIAVTNGGGAYLGGGELTVSGSAVISENKSKNGAGAMVANGNVTVSGGTITKNTASENGGGVSVTNGNFTMTGGTVTDNTAAQNGGGIYVSSTQAADSGMWDITVRSGQLTNNRAEISGGALGVVGQTPGVKFTITIGSNTVHGDELGNDRHACRDNDGISEPCPEIKGNTSGNSGGGIFLSGSYDATMNMYCLVEVDNNVKEKDAEGKGASASNFMKVEGGTLLISTIGNDEKSYGNVVINSSIHVTGGKVTVQGNGDNPLFKEPVTVDVNQTAGATFDDYRQGGNAYSVQYFENSGETDAATGQYFFVDSLLDLANPTHTIQASSYQKTGFVFSCWYLMKKDGDKYVPVDETEYKPDGTIVVDEDNRKLVFYAQWEPVAFRIVFEAGVPNFENTMADQTFSYVNYVEWNGQIQLNPNQFINVGNRFVGWKNEDTGKAYTAGVIDDVVLTGNETEAITITLIAQWVDCTHWSSEMERPTAIRDEAANTATLTRRCKCHGYSETVVLNGIAGSYNGEEYKATYQQTTAPQNEAADAELWSIQILYSGKSYGNVSVEPDTHPTNAGEYQASIAVDGGSISVDVLIRKAEQAPPAEPQYKIDQDNGKDVITVIAPNDETGKTLQYKLWWYNAQNELGCIDEWTDWRVGDATVSWNPSENYTNYLVEVRYQGDHNHEPSKGVKGVKLFFNNGTVRIEIGDGDGLVVTPSTEGSGLDLLIQAEDIYYLYAITSDISKSDPNYTLEVGKIEYISNKEAKAHVVIPTYTKSDANTNENKDQVVVTIRFAGAKLLTTVKAETVKDPVFDIRDVRNKGEEGVEISRDSAYTVLFTVDNYDGVCYENPTVIFSSALPTGTKIILKDQSDSSYWSHTVPGENGLNQSIPLNAFVRMGTSDDKYSRSGDQTSLTLQFVVDFSGCSEMLALGTQLTVRLAATPIQPMDPGNPSQKLQTVPNLPDDGTAKSAVTLVAAPIFTVDNDESSATENLTQVIGYSYGQVGESVSVGVSKWNARRGVLVLTPQDVTELPADIQLKMSVGNVNATYWLADGKFIVAIPREAGNGEILLRLHSDMFAKESSAFQFTVDLYVSDTTVGTVLGNSAGTYAGFTSLTFDKAESKEIAVDAKLAEGSLPTYMKGSDNTITFTPVVFTGQVSDLPEGYKVKVTLYTKKSGDRDYTYSSVVKEIQVENGNFVGFKAESDGGEASLEGTGCCLELGSLSNDLSSYSGNLSLKLVIHVEDPNELVVESVPLYCILIGK